MNTVFTDAVQQGFFVRLFRRSPQKHYSVFIPRPDAFSNFLPIALTDVELKKVIDSKDEFVSAVLSGSIRLNDFGNTFRSLVQGRDFIDLCCGDPSISTYPRFFAQAFNARCYKGVDSKHVTSKTVIGEYPEFPGFKSEYYRADLLDFLKHENLSVGGAVIYLSGIEPRSGIHTREYIGNCELEIIRLTKNGGGIIIGQGTFGFDFKEGGLKLTASKNHHRIYVHN